MQYHFVDVSRHKSFYAPTEYVHIKPQVEKRSAHARSHHEISRQHLPPKTHSSTESGPMGTFKIQRRGVWIEERNRERTTNRIGRASSEQCELPQVYYSKFFYTQIQKGGKSKNFLAKNKQHNFFHTSLNIK